MDPKNLPGSLKIAILVQALGKESSKLLMEPLSSSDKEKINRHLSQMGKIPSDLVEKVALEFAETMKRKKEPKPALVSNTLKKETEDTVQVPGSSNLATIQELPPSRLRELIKSEHPQTIAVVLAHVKPDIASSILSKLPEDIQADVALRIATLDNVMSGMVEELDQVFGDVLKNETASTMQKAGGINRLAEILNQVDSSMAEMILDEMEEDNPDLVEEIKQGMFVFEDIVMVDDKGLQKLLRSVETKELAIALKAASEGVRQKIFSNMSERAGDMVKDEIESLGAVRMKEVEDAQRIITKIIQELEEKGELIIQGRGGEKIIA